VVDVPGRVSPLAHVAAAHNVADAPHRLERHRQHGSASAHTCQFGERALWVRHVFEHLDGQHQVELSVGESQRRRVALLCGDASPTPLCSQVVVRQVDSHQSGLRVPRRK